MRTQSILLEFIAFGLANREWLAEVGYVIIIDNKNAAWSNQDTYIHLEQTTHLRCVYLSVNLRACCFMNLIMQTHILMK